MLKPGLDVEFRPPQPSPARVARRALLLTALACRADLEPHAGDPAADAIAADVRAWLLASGVLAEAEPLEEARLAAPLGAAAGPGLPASPGESAAVLAWGLGRAALPPIDVAADALAVGEALGWLDADVAGAIEAARLRPRTDLVLLAEALDVAAWRLAAARDGTVAASLAQFAPGRRRGAADAAPLPLDEAGELLLSAVPLPAAEPAAIAAADRRVEARRRALLWLLGQAGAFSAVRVDR